MDDSSADGDTAESHEQQPGDGCGYAYKHRRGPDHAPDHVVWSWSHVAVVVVVVVVVVTVVGFVPPFLRFDCCVT